MPGGGVLIRPLNREGEAVIEVEDGAGIPEDPPPPRAVLLLWKSEESAWEW
jgi:hypothetical protein